MSQLYLFNTEPSDGAVIVGNWRYYLWRQVSDQPGRALFIMLNPSTADAETDDLTVKKCKGFTSRMGLGRLDIVNLFAWRTTYPTDLINAGKAGEDIVGPENDKWICAAASRANRIICAWGNDGGKSDREKSVFNILRGYSIESLGELTKQGNPYHPSRIGYSRGPQVMSHGGHA